MVTTAPRTLDSGPSATRGTVLVTGGAGFIGSYLVESLLDEKYGVVCLDNFDPFYDPAIKEANLTQARRWPFFTLIRGDILNLELVEEIFARHAIEKVVHLAALAGVRPSLASPARYVDVDVKGTVHLLEAACRNGVRQFVLGSSSSVYGASPHLPYREDQPTEHQVSPYAAAKRAAEVYCATYQSLYGVPVTVLRFFTVYGPRQRPDMAIHKFTRLLHLGEPVPLYGNGTSARDYGYIDDTVAGIMAALEHPFPYEVFNLGSGQLVSLTELLQVVAEAVGVTPKSHRLPDQPGDVPTTWADTSKAQRLLGYQPQVSLQEGVSRFVSWYREHRHVLEGVARP